MRKINQAFLPVCTIVSRQNYALGKSMKTLKNIKRHKLQESQNLKREIKIHKYSKKVVNVKDLELPLFVTEMYS